MVELKYKNLEIVFNFYSTQISLKQYRGALWKELKLLNWNYWLHLASQRVESCSVCLI